jgi:DNA-binding CsgD family transcriptional regulator
VSRYLSITRPMPAVLEYLRPRIVEEGDCWIWKQLLDRNHQPKATIGCMYSVNVRRWILSCKLGDLGKRVASTKCETRGCVNPDHLFATSVRDAIQAAARRGAHSHAQAVANRTMANRARAKLAGRRDEILAMRLQGLSYRAIAEIIGCNQSAIGNICRGRYHVPVVAGASVFSWRPA